MMPFTNPFHRYLPVFTLVAVLIGVYLATMAPGLTWANDGSDGGDLITAAYTGGVTHPTGYPLYLILARIFQFIPTGSLAYRTNLMSTMAAALSAAFIYLIVTRSLAVNGGKDVWLAGLTAGLSFGFAPMVWSQAVITEVYALQACLTVLILYLFVFPPPQIGWKKQESLRGLLMGMAMGNHVTTILLLPMIFFSSVIKWNDSPVDGINIEDNNRQDNRLIASSLIRQLLWFAIGLFIYLTLPLRALTQPPVNWGNPITFERFWWLVSGELYRSYYLQFQLAGIGERVQAWASLLLAQFGWLGVFTGMIGLTLPFRLNRLYFYTIWMGAVYSFFAIFYSTNDSYVYLISVYVSFAIWLGLGIGFALEKITCHSRWAVLGLCLLLTGYFIFSASHTISLVDASRDLRAEEFGRQVMAQVPKDALVFVKGDKAVFAIWYFHFALGYRPDLIVIAEELLHFDWYQETLQAEYPILVIPGPFPWAQNVMDSNSAWPACFIEYTSRPEITCD